jgi:formate hydrogenlyase subunit 3/multisubunit Na+/H+ antiporter MnhD subunit
MDFNIINPALLIAVPLLFAFIAIMMKKADKVVLSLAVILNVCYSIYSALIYSGTVVYEIGGFKPPFGISLVVDGYALIGMILLNVVFALMVLMNFRLIGKYATVLLVSLASLNGIILTGDLFNLFVFLEISAIAAYIITAMDKGFKHTFNYLVLGTLASGLYLFGIIVIYNLFGTLNIADLSAKVGGVAYAAMTLPMVFIFAGLSVETKLLPFSGWVKGVLKNANGLIGSLIVSAYATAMLLMFGRLLNSVFVFEGGLLVAFSAIAVLTLVLAEASAFASRKLREVLLFSSIAQSGLVVVLFINGLILPAVLVLANNVISKLVLFTMSAKFANDTGSDKIYELKGIFTQYKCLGIGFTISAMSMVGLPLFFGFIAKANVLIALMQGGNIWLPIVILLVAVVEGIYFIRILTNLWNAGEEGKLSKLEDVKDFGLKNYITIGIVALIIGLFIIAAGILPIENIQKYFDAEFLSLLSNTIGGV